MTLPAAFAGSGFRISRKCAGVSSTRFRLKGLRETRFSNATLV